jgi:hypothetical protein
MIHRTLSVLVALFLVSSFRVELGAAREVRFPTIPAHWVDDADDFEPLRGGDFMFDALSFSSASDGWIVGDRYILRLAGDVLELQFLRSSGINLNTVQASALAGTLVGGSEKHRGGRSRGILLRRNASGWREEALSSDDFENWFVTNLRVSDFAGWASGIDRLAQAVRHPLWQRDAGVWHVDRTHRSITDEVWTVARFCLDPSGDGWFVGSEWTHDRQRRGLIARQRAGQFERAPLPELPGPSSYVNHVVCFDDGKALAAAVVNVSGYALTETGGKGILLEYDGAWHPIEFPPHLDGYRAGAIAALSANDVWLVLDEPYVGAVKFVHWHDRRWDEIPPPVLPDGRTRGYVVSDMQFVSAAEGWAVANDYDGPGIVRGLIFHYRDGVWRNRNWNWHFWHQPGFGLFGD